MLEYTPSFQRFMYNVEILIHLEFIFCERQEIRIEFLFSTCRHAMLPVPFVEEADYVIVNYHNVKTENLFGKNKYIEKDKIKSSE